MTETKPMYINKPGKCDEGYPPICIDDDHFLISQKDFDELPVYQTSRPTGVHDGKCWKHHGKSEWFITCYIEETPPHPCRMLTPTRFALIV